MKFWNNHLVVPPAAAAGADTLQPLAWDEIYRQHARKRGAQWLTALQKQHTDYATPPSSHSSSSSSSNTMLSSSGVTMTPRLRAIRFNESSELRAEFLNAVPLTRLYAHQEDAVAFMAAREAAANPAGGILADDMRLGKTLVIYAFLLRDLQRRVALGKEDRFGRPTLVVVPNTLLHVWHSELEKHFGSTRHPLACVVIDDDESDWSARRIIREADLVLTTYPQLIGHKHDRALHGIHWRRLVADEAHTFASGAHPGVVNKSLQRMQSIRAEFRWFVSATPIQNSSRDLGTALLFIGVAHAEAFAPPTLPAFRDLVQRVLLRRRWAEIHTTTMAAAAPLTACDHLVLLDFDTAAEATLYEHYVAIARYKFMQQHQQQQHSTAAVAEEPMADEKHALRFITQLRQLCLNPMLVRDLRLPPTLRSSGRDAVDAAMELLWRERALYASPTALPPPSTMAAVAERAENGGFRGLLPPVFTKERWVLDYIRTVGGGDKVVIYSTYKHVLRRLFLLLEERAPGTTRLIDGHVPTATRHVHLNAFATDPAIRCLLITKGVGRHGLALTCATHVILLDLWWNPTVDDQAIARVFDGRATDRTVHISVLAIRNSIDEYVAQIADAKRALDKLLPVERAIRLYDEQQQQQQQQHKGRRQDTFFSHALLHFLGLAA